MKMRFGSSMTVMALVAFVTVLGNPCLRADSLELKSGQIIKGRFLAGSELNIRFLVDGKEQIFATKDVLDLVFSDISAAPATDDIGATKIVISTALLVHAFISQYPSEGPSHLAVKMKT